MPRLTPDEIEEIRLHAHRYAGPYTPTYHRLATAVKRLAEHLQETAAVCADDLPTAEETAAARNHILRGANELKAGGGRPEPSACANCRYWREIADADDDRGECRRRPPVASAGVTPFPQSHATDWCGEWEGKSPHPLRVLG